MTIHEFQTYTDVYPDYALYQAACAEYEKKNADGTPVWESQAQFCHAYKFNEDGLAESIQLAAIKSDEERTASLIRLRAENNRLKEMTEFTLESTDLYQELDCAMAEATRNLMDDEYSAEDIGLAWRAFDYLCKALRGYGEDD